MSSCWTTDFPANVLVGIQSDDTSLYESDATAVRLAAPDKAIDLPSCPSPKLSGKRCDDPAEQRVAMDKGQISMSQRADTLKGAETAPANVWVTLSTARPVKETSNGGTRYRPNA